MNISSFIVEGAVSQICGEGLDFLSSLAVTFLMWQVTRLVKVRLGVGDGEVVLKNLSKSLDKDSVRVDGIGPASITEVSFQVSG